MLTVQAGDLLDRLKQGVLDPLDVQFLERTLAQDVLAELGELYPIRFQDRRHRQKWEVSLAAALRYELVLRRAKSDAFPILQLVPVLRHCVFLSGEHDMVSGISIATRVMVRPIRKPSPGLAIFTGRGFKMDRTPDGWEIKPMPKRTVHLSEDFLRERGWQFHVFQPLAPRP